MAIRGVRSSGAYFDASELTALSIDLKGAPLRLQLDVGGKVMARAGDTLKDEMKKDAAGHRYLRHLPKSVTWERKGAYEIEAGLGPRPGKTQGSLAHIIVHGSVNNVPVYDYTAAERRAVPRIMRWIADGAEDSVLGGDGR